MSEKLDRAYDQMLRSAQGEAPHALPNLLGLPPIQPYQPSTDLYLAGILAIALPVCTLHRGLGGYVLHPYPAVCVLGWIIHHS